MATYFVKNGGNDEASGLSHADAWATIAKVNSFSFAPSDVVQFCQLHTFEGCLDSSHFAGVTFRSYDPASGDPSAAGTRALLQNTTPVNVVHVTTNTDDIVLDNLELATNEPVTGAGSHAVVMNSSSAPVCRDWTIRNCYIHQAGGSGVQTIGAGSTGWTIEGTAAGLMEIADVGDCGWLIDAVSSGHEVDGGADLGVTIHDTGGFDAAYGRHGIYAKGAVIVHGVEFYANVNGQSVSIRREGSEVYGCYFHDTAEGAVYFFDATGTGGTGTVYIYQNILDNVPNAFFADHDVYFDMVIASNTLRGLTTGCAANFAALLHASVEFKNNIVSGGDHAFWGHNPDLDSSEETIEDYNCWYNQAEYAPFQWNGSFYEPSAYQAASGQSEHAVYSDPILEITYPFALDPYSPAIDTGTPDVAGLTYTQ